MDILLLFLGFIFMIGGIVGSFVPILPGPLTSWIGLLLLYITKAVPMSYTALIITLIVALGIYILDYFIPAMGTKKYGGSRYGVIGTTLGLLIGIIFFPPFGIIIGPFLGALIGEYLYDASDSRRAFKAAFGSFLGFVTSAFLKFFVASIYLAWFVWVTVSNSTAFFG